ncbi:MAG: RNA polymerase sporulation sigma factor SigK [Clostridiales bacterium]|jgi:RNA polymerase sporulation-specific sigma factor|nr:RNA polymerase sporulation sigma factor SigK [Clostridiales bacterium]
MTSGGGSVILDFLNLFFVFSYIAGNSFPKPLSGDEERAMLKRYAQGDEEAKNVLIERNLRLVAHIVKKYSNHSGELEDLISVGTIGLIKGITTYNLDKGTKLATYAARCIDNEILMFLRSSKKYSNDLYLQEPIGVDREGNEVTMEDKIADDKNTIDEQVNLKMQIKSLYEKMKSILKGREKTVIELRYGLYNGEEVTQREIAEMLNISRSYVSRIEKKALNKLSREIRP